MPARTGLSLVGWARPYRAHAEAQACDDQGIVTISKPLLAALLLLPPSAPAAKAETNHPSSQQAAELEKSQDNDKNDDKNDAKPKVSVAITGPQAGTVITAPA